jgi:NAD(P)-dependent dehydrogenase (short-subunit alcohol dehydrogenase family)
MQLANKVILITGRASGLGEACVRLLSQTGAKFVIADLNNVRGM